jgi:integrase
MPLHKENQAVSRRPEAAPGYESIVPNPKLKLLDQMREVMRLKHYSIRTERSYCDWVRRYVQFHKMLSREAMFPAEPKIEAFLSHLAVDGNVAVSTQNQAFNALLFVYREVFHLQLGNIDSVRATRPARVPTVLTPDEAKQIIGAMTGMPQLIVKLLYGSGLRLLEALRLRVQDVDFGMKQITVRDGKGAKDRYTMLPESVIRQWRIAESEALAGDVSGIGKCADNPGGEAPELRVALWECEQDADEGVRRADETRGDDLRMASWLVQWR